MKKIIILLFLISLLGCMSQQEVEEYRRNLPKVRFKVGDVAYLKPDSTKCVIYYFGGNHYNPCYAVKYTDKNGIQHTTGTGWSSHLLSESEFF